MRVPRIFVDIELAPQGQPVLPEGPARHLSQVLRLAPGSPVALFNGDGRDYSARVLETGRRGLKVSIDGAGEPEPPPPLSIRLAIGVSRGERMDYALQKAVELGVEGITPLFTSRGLVQLAGTRLERRLDHWRGIVVGACEQSGRRRLPELHPAETLASWIETAPAGGLLLDPAAKQTLVGLPRPGPEITLLVGPEGGLDAKERALAGRHGFRPVRLGPRILRTETAPLAAIAVIQALWGDLGR